MTVTGFYFFQSSTSEESYVTELRVKYNVYQVSDFFFKKDALWKANKLTYYLFFFKHNAKDNCFTKSFALFFLDIGFIAGTILLIISLF